MEGDLKEASLKEQSLQNAVDSFLHVLWIHRNPFSSDGNVFEFLTIVPTKMNETNGALCSIIE